MSTYLYLACTAHTPQILARDECGQHLEDLPRIRDFIRDRDKLVAHYNDDEFEFPNYWRTGDVHDYWLGVAVTFFTSHPECPLVIVSEYGDEYAPTERDN